MIIPRHSRYDDWKSTEPDDCNGSMICDGCRVMIPADLGVWHSGEFYCPRCQEKYLGELDGEFAE
jgi:formylmethanofuran dehydrogenase subunit E